MKTTRTKSPKVCVCQRCLGCGTLADSTRCPQCQGSGLVTVSQVVTYDIRPFRRAGAAAQAALEAPHLYPPRHMSRKRPGCSYQRRVEAVTRLYDKYAAMHLTTREIWRRYIYPTFGISERTLYNMMHTPYAIDPPASASPRYFMDDLFGSADSKEGGR